MLRFAQQAVSALRPLFQDRNVDELVQHFPGCSPHCLVGLVLQKIILIVFAILLQLLM